MITKNEYRAMFTADRDAARETVKAWRNAVEALDRIQTEDLIAEETPAHTVSLFVNEVGENLARFVIASLINASAWDGRIYSNVAEWAKGQHSLDEEATQDAMLYSRMHKAHLNQIGEAMMKYQPTTTEEAQEATTEATEATEKEEEQNTMTSTEKLTKDNRHSLKAGDELRFSNGDEYTVDTIIDTGRSVCFTLTDKRDGKRIYSHPSSECYGAEIIRAAEAEEDTDTNININEKENDTMITNNTNTKNETIAETAQQKTDRENWEHCKSIALELDRIAEGSAYKCPHCGEIIFWSDDQYDDDEATYTCPECGETFDECDLEPFGIFDYFSDCYDIEYRIGSDKQFRSVRLLVAYGGPNIYIDTASGNVELYWWTDRASYALASDTIDAINAEFEELYACC